MPDEINADKLMRAISLLTALQSSIQDSREHGDITESHVNEFHTVLSKIADIGIDTADFLVPDSELKPRVTSVSRRGTSYSKTKYIRKSIFLTKLDGILNYLNYILKEPKRSAGFKPKE